MIAPAGGKPDCATRQGRRRNARSSWPLRVLRDEASSLSPDFLYPRRKSGSTLVDLDAGKRSTAGKQAAHLRLDRRLVFVAKTFVPRADHASRVDQEGGRHHAHAKLLGHDAVGIAQDLERCRMLEEPLPYRSVVASMLIATTRMPVRAASCR